MSSTSPPLSSTSVSTSAVSSQSSATSRGVWPFVGAGVALFLLGAGATATAIHHNWRRSGTIAPRVRIAGVPVGGLSPTEAKARLTEKFDAQTVSLRVGEEVTSRSLSELGGAPQFAFAALQAAKLGRDGHLLSGTWNFYTRKSSGRNFALPVNWNAEKRKRALQTLAKGYARAPQNARLQFVSGAMTVVGGQNGRALDVAKAEKALARYRLGASEVVLPIQSVAPSLTVADLQGRDVLLGTYTTKFKRRIVGRSRNIWVSAQAVDGSVLMPNEEFSFNRATGERTWEKGYRMAPIFVTRPGQSKAEVVTDLAGGICQTSSTLYNAVRLSNEKFSRGLDVTERNHHSLPVDYVRPGWDAAVAWGQKDFRFRNTTRFPVYLRAQVNGARITTSVWARVPGNAQLTTAR